MKSDRWDGGRTSDSESRELRPGLDHVLIAVRNLDQASLTFGETLGFTLTPAGLHPGRGTHNRLIVLPNGYLELLAVHDQVEAKTARSQLVSFLRSREGLFMLALGTEAITPAVASLQGRGVSISEPIAGARQGRSGGSGYTWRYAPIEPAALPGARAFLIQHDEKLCTRYPDPPGADRHDNGSVGIHHLAIAVKDAGEAAARWQALFDLCTAPAMADWSTAGETSVFLQLRNCSLAFVSPSGEGRASRFLAEFGEGLFLLALEVADLDHAIGFLTERGVAVSKVRESAGGKTVEVMAPQAHGVLLELVQPLGTELGEETPYRNVS